MKINFGSKSMLKKSIINLGLILVLSTAFFGAVINWDFVKISNWLQEEFKIAPEEGITLSKDKSFTEDVTLSGVGENYDPKNVSYNCEDFKGKITCDKDSKKSEKKIVVKLEADYFKTTKEVIELKISYKDKTPERTLKINIPPRITEIKVKVGDAEPSEKNPLSVELVKDATKAVSVTYKSDGEPNADFELESSDKKIVSVSDKKIKGEAVNTTNVDVKSKEKKFVLKSLKVTVIPIIKEIALNPGASLDVKETETLSLGVTVKDDKENPVNLNRIECKETLDPDNIITSVTPKESGFDIVAGSLPGTTAQVVKITCSPIDDNGGNSVALPIEIKVQPKPASPITKIVIKAGDEEVKGTLTLVENNDKPITVKYVQDEKTKTDFELQSNKKEIVDIKNKTTLSPVVQGDAIVKVISTDKKIEIDSFIVKVVPAINKIDSPGGNVLKVNETDPTSFEVNALDKSGNSLGFERIECLVEEKIKNLVSLTPNKLGYDIKTFSLPLESDGKTTIAKDGKIICSVKDNGGVEVTPLDITITILPKNGYMNIEPLDGTVLLPNGSISFLINVFDLESRPQTARIQYELEMAGNKNYVSLAPQGSRLKVSWVDLAADGVNDKKGGRPSHVRIQVSAFIKDVKQPIIGFITIHMTAVAKFSSLKVKLNVMDNRTVSDLYGAVTNDEYHVVMVRLFNDLKDKDTNKFEGQSILAYSSSIEIAVALEKQFDSDQNTGDLGTILTKDEAKILKDKRKATNIADLDNNLTQLDSLYKTEVEEFNKRMRDFSEKDRLATQLEIQSQTDASLKKAAETARATAGAAYEAALQVSDKIRNLYRDYILLKPQMTLPPGIIIDDGKWYQASREDLIKINRQNVFLKDEDDDSPVSVNDNEPNCADTVLYKPLTFEMIVNTVDRRETRSPRSRIFQILNFIGLGTSVVTSIAVPSKKSDLPLGLEKYGNVLIPGLEKLFPSLKEQHRQNIVSQTMKPIEEIPFGSDITRVLFIPKKSIEGLIVGHKARISQICPFYFKVKVAVVSKGSEVTLTN